MNSNPYQAPHEPPEKAASTGRPAGRGWLVLLPVCWWFVTAIKGIGSDSVQFPVPVAIGLTIGILVQMAVLAYAVQGWWRILTAPIWLLLLMDLLILWFWNVRVW